MLPPVLQSIADECRLRFRAVMAADVDRELIPDFLAAEQVATAFAQEVGLGMAQDFVDVRAEQALAHRPLCACGAKMEVHRRSPWKRKMLLGVVTVRDPYTFCRDCGASDRPLHAWLGTDREPWSLLAEEAAVDFASDESCGRAVDKLARHHPGVDMGRTTALRLLHEHGAKARAFIDNTLDVMRCLAEEPLSPKTEDDAEELEVEFDGGMIPVGTLEPIPVEEGKTPELTRVRKLPKRRKNLRWEEVKAGLVQKPGEKTRLYALRPTAGLDEAFDDLFGLAVMKGWTPRTLVRGLADGARHIRTRMAEVFHASPFQFILDRPHCKEHLTSAGTVLAPAGLSVQEWANAALAKMENGRTPEVVAELAEAYAATGGEDIDERTKTLRREAAYFERNKDSVAYAEYRDRGWSTASSEIESAHGDVVQQRLKIAGAWWHPDHVDDILALRMLRKNGWWDDYWGAQRCAWSERATTFREGRPSRAA
jgi:hypothetical protein